MPGDDSSIINPLEVKSYSEYLELTEWLVRKKGYERHGCHPFNSDTSDLESQGYKVAKVKPHYNPETRTPVLGMATFFKKKLHR